MRYAKIDPALFVANRARLRERLPPGALAVLNANDVLPTNADGVLKLRQNSDLFYLSGIDQEETVLVLFPDAPDEKHREVLFLKETSETVAIWEGQKHSKASATEASGIANVRWLNEFPSLFRTFMKQADEVFLNGNEHVRASDTVESRDLRFVRETQHRFPLHRYRRLAPLLESLRAIKSPPEVDLIRHACEITGHGFRRVLGFIKPGVREYEIEAEFLHEFLRRGSDGFAYDPIIGGGANACVLHYLENDDTCHDGDLLLMDVAARYANYNSDLTRTVPVNGRFTGRQRAVYDAVLRTLRAASGLLRPGVLIKDYHEEIGKLVESELLALGLLTRSEIDAQDPDKPAYKKFFMHGTSHHLGLDVHDVGDTTLPVAPGMVFTIEPGIYIREEMLGVRLENDFLIGADANTDLMADIPIEADDIESLMQGDGQHR